MQITEDKWFNPAKGARYNFQQHPQLRTGIICVFSAVLMLVAICVDDVGPVSSIEGAITVLGIEALFPILMAWKVGKASVRMESNDMPNYTSLHLQHARQKGPAPAKTRPRHIVYLGALLLIGILLGIGGICLQSWVLLSD